jgi:hypothetical protein
MRFNSKKKKGYPKSGSRFIDKVKDVGTPRGAKQAAAGVAIVTDLATGANISRLPFQALGKAGTKLAEGAGHLRRGAGAFKNTLASAYQKSRKGSTPSKPSSSKPLQITAGGTKPLRLYGIQIGSGRNPNAIITPAPKPNAPRQSGSIPQHQINQTTGRPFPKNSLAGGKPGSAGRNVRVPLVRGAETYTRAAIMKKGFGPGSPLPKSGLLAVATEQKRVDAIKSSITKTKDASTKKTKKLASSAPPKSNLPASANARDTIASKIKDTRKKTNTIVAKKTKQIGTKPKTTVVKPKVTPKSPGVVYNASSKMKPKVKMNPKGGKNILNPAGAAVGMVLEMSKQKNPEKYQKGILGFDAAKNSLPGILANTTRGKQAAIKVRNIKSNIKSKITKVKKRFKF